jgi:hypothetical protein
MSAKCHKQAWCDLFYHVVGPDPASGDHRRRVITGHFVEYDHLTLRWAAGSDDFK